MTRRGADEDAEAGRELLLDLVALFNTEAAHAGAESERARLADEAQSDRRAGIADVCNVSEDGVIGGGWHPVSVRVLVVELACMIGRRIERRLFAWGGWWP